MRNASAQHEQSRKTTGLDSIFRRLSAQGDDHDMHGEESQCGDRKATAALA